MKQLGLLGLSKLIAVTSIFISLNSPYCLAQDPDVTKAPDAATNLPPTPTKTTSATTAPAVPGTPPVPSAPSAPATKAPSVAPAATSNVPATKAPSVAPAATPNASATKAPNVAPAAAPSAPATKAPNVAPAAAPSAPATKAPSTIPATTTPSTPAAKMPSAAPTTTLPSAPAAKAPSTIPTTTAPSTPAAKAPSTIPTTAPSTPAAKMPSAAPTTAAPSMPVAKTPAPTTKAPAATKTPTAVTKASSVPATKAPSAAPATVATKKPDTAAKSSEKAKDKKHKKVKKKATSLKRAGIDSKPSSWIVPNAPETYIVKNGDTLWDIACMFLNDPWRWKKVWMVNPNIENPNLIYPGDKLHLRYVNGNPQIHVERGTSWESIDKRTGVTKLRPRIRSYPSEKPIPTIALNVIAPFLNKSRVVNENQATCSPVIVGLDENRIVVGTGDRVFVEGLSPRIPDTVYAVFRPGKEYIDPQTNICLGIEGLVLGTVERESGTDPSRFLVLHSYEDIKRGDRLIGTLEAELDAYFVPKTPEGDDVTGQIISVFGGMTQIGQFQVVVITGGEDKCRQVGDVLAIYQTIVEFPRGAFPALRKLYRFPPLNIGNCLVFRVFDKVSYALVMGATRPIILLDDVRSP